MPVVAVAAAAFAGAELVAGGLTVLETIAAVGAVTAGVGVVTGNKGFTQIGAVMGVVGGVGALAQEAGLISDVGNGWTSTGLMSSTEAATAPAVASETAAVPNPVKSATAAVPNPVESATPTLPATTPEPVATPSEGVAPAVQSAAPVAQGVLNTTVPIETSPWETAAATSATQNATMQVANPTGPGAMSSLSEWMKPFTTFARENAMATYGMMQVGGAALQGLFNPLTSVQKAALEAQTSKNLAESELVQRQTANIGGPLPVASSAAGTRPSPFLAMPSQYAPVNVASGLLNTAAPNAANVTGRPA